MRILLLSALVLACVPARKAGEEVHPDAAHPSSGVLRLHATYTAPYCGGADPGFDGMPRPEPWSGPMFLRPAAPDSTGMALNDLDRPILDTLRTNALGEGWLELPVGSYLLLDAEHVDRSKHDELLRDHAKPAMYTTPIDKACLRQWLYGPFGVIAITGGDTLRVELPLSDPCPWYAIPCVHYNGPLPP